MASSTSAASRRSARASGSIRRLSAEPLRTAVSAYRPSAVATPRAADMPTCSDVRAVRVTSKAATAPTGTAIPYPAISPATSAAVMSARERAFLAGTAAAERTPRVRQSPTGGARRRQTWPHRQRPAVPSQLFIELLTGPVLAPRLLARLRHVAGDLRIHAHII